MKINVKHVAKLANLELTDSEVEKFDKQLSSILDYIKKLQEVDTSSVKETSQVTGLENVTREDEAHPSFSQEEALANAPQKENGFIKVKAILEG